MVDKKELSKNIENLSSTEHEEIFKIIKENNVHYSKNKNGFFFNITTLENNILMQIDKFVKYCMSNQNDLDLYEKKMNECKLSHNYEIFNIKLNTMKEIVPIVNVANENNWNDVMIDTKIMQKIISFTDRAIYDREKNNKKKVNVKFNNARKRWSKQQYNLGGFGNDDYKELTSDKYLIGEFIIVSSTLTPV